MKELELKYGCNPNQKPSKIYMEDGSELPIKVLFWKTWIYQFPGCLLMAGSWLRDLKKSNRASGGNFFQACFTSRGVYRTSAE